jgi:hypothetical protein
VTQLIFKRASASRPSGEWSEDDYDALADGVAVRPHLQGARGTRRNTVAVDAGLRAS